MDSKALINKIKAGEFDSQFKMLYGETDAPKERYIKAILSFNEIFPNHINDDIRIFSAPGRTEIGGNHTDHQHGMVLAGSTDLDVIAIAALNTDNMVRIKSEGFDADILSIGELNKNETEIGKSISLIRGILYSFAEKEMKIGGFDAYTTSKVVKGSGLSSSAAFEVLVSGMINDLFNGGKLGFIDIAKISQFAEREYFGKPCGLLDQMASAAGGVIFADFDSPAEPKVEKMDFDISHFGYKLCVVNTGGNHSDLTGDYADITNECKKVSKLLGVEFLRDADENKFYSDIAEIRKEAGDRAVLRAHHFFSEEKRVLSAKEAIISGNMDAFLQNIKKSGISSISYLQNLYSVSNVREQALILGLAISETVLGDRGAYRVHGGGFAGTIQCYVPDEYLEKYKIAVENAFGNNSLFILNIRPVGFHEMI